MIHGTMDEMGVAWKDVDLCVGMATSLCDLKYSVLQS